MGHRSLTERTVPAVWADVGAMWGDGDSRRVHHARPWPTLADALQPLAPITGIITTA